MLLLEHARLRLLRLVVAVILSLLVSIGVLLLIQLGRVCAILLLHLPLIGCVGVAAVVADIVLVRLWRELAFLGTALSGSSQQRGRRCCKVRRLLLVAPVQTLAIKLLSVHCAEAFAAE